MAAVVAVVGEIKATVSGHQDARAQEKAQRKQLRANKRLALEILGEQTFDIRMRTAQQRAQIGAEIGKVTRAALGQRGAIAASAGAANVAGQTVEDLLLDTEVQEGRARGNLRLAQEFREFDAEREILSLRLGTRGRILGLQANPVNRPAFDLTRTAAAGAQGFELGGQIGSIFGGDTVPDTRGGGDGGAGFGGRDPSSGAIDPANSPT